MRHRKSFTAIVVLGIVASSNASITSFTEYSGAGALQYDFNTYYQYNTTSTLPGSFVSPYTSNSPTGDFMDNVVSFNNSLTSNTSSHVSSIGYFSGGADADKVNGPTYALSEVYGYDEYVFTTDSNAQVTMQTSGTSQVSFGAGNNNGYLYLDGTYYDMAPADSLWTITVGAGSHTLLYEGLSYAEVDGVYSFTGSASLTQTYNLDVVTPEPATLAVLGVAGIGLLRRKRRG